MRLRDLATLVVLFSALLCVAGETSPATAPAPDLLAMASGLSLRPAPFYEATAVQPRLVSPHLLSEQKQPAKVFDKKFAFLAAVSTALTIADYEMTSDCLARHACAEADPLLPRNRTGMYATNIPLNAVLFYWSYRRKAAGKKMWWLPPAAIIGSHVAGVATNLRYR